MALVDVFDALISERPYKAAFSKKKTISIIREERGKHFDPAIVNVFFDHLEEIMPIAEKWKDGQYSMQPRRNFIVASLAAYAAE